MAETLTPKGININITEEEKYFCDVQELQRKLSAKIQKRHDEMIEELELGWLESKSDNKLKGISNIATNGKDN